MANTLLRKYMEKMKEELRAKLKEEFALFDKENTGFIKCEDLGKVMRSIGENPTDDELKNAIDILDPDKNGIVGFTEFLNFMAPMLRDDDPKEYPNVAASKIFEKDQDGFISAAELGKGIQEMSFRWPRERLDKAEKTLIEALKALNATVDAPVVRNKVKEKCLETVRDTGLVNHVLARFEGSNENVVKRRENPGGRGKVLWLEEVTSAENSTITENPSEDEEEASPPPKTILQRAWTWVKTFSRERE